VSPLVGVLALQGGVREHASLLESLGAGVRLVRRVGELAGLDALVLPGGESSVMDRLLRGTGLGEPLAAAIRAGLPTLGTCAGLVLLATELVDPAPGQQTLGVLDVTVQRNAFGSQVVSEESVLDTALGTARVAFIRAPRVVRVGTSVTELARHHGSVVAVRSGAVIGVSFHPELTGDATFHDALLTLARGRVDAA
jgi:5'-phosphate synthase pdxT subunit